MKRSVLGFLLLLSAHLRAQTPQRDNWLWLSAEVRKEVFKDLVVAVNAEGRLNENYQNVRAFFGEVEVTYKVNEYLSGSLQYRYGGRENDISDFVRGQRLTGFVYGRFKYNKLTLTNRLGYFQQYLTLEPGDDRTTPETYWRNRLQLKFDLTKKIEPLIAAEFFYRTFDNRDRIDEWRYIVGLEVQLNKQHSLKPVFIHSKQVNVRRPDIRNIFSIGYYYTLPGKKKEQPVKS
jgi:hypothetical protein